MTDPAGRSVVGEVAIGLGVAALGGFVAFEAGEITASPTYAKVGPQVIPYAVAAVLALLGLTFAAGALRWPASVGEEGTDWAALAAVSAGLIAQMLLLRWAGFVIAGAILFFCVAVGFGSRRFLRDGMFAIALTLVVYLGFTRGLDLQLPAGLLAGLL